MDVEVHAVDRGERVKPLGQAAGVDEDIGLDGHGRLLIVPMEFQVGPIGPDPLLTPPLGAGNTTHNVVVRE
jgi:hypothetical protein